MGKGGAVLWVTHRARCDYLQVKYFYVTLQSHGPWKDFKFWSCRHSGVLLP